ncbi:ferric uptake regulation protein [bacterium BMS3Bbin06]|nr:ferric uptake regulation protein [bacterium BMS3Abin08]GBE34476.1 ferric uptake regulation protein [bacterium BMS3Bbin06]HDO35700.1 transcriptional repressor [Nitrospirota bacterium]HDY72062.1 transcriptional repressor [Nitrospirota bacterium]
MTEEKNIFAEYLFRNNLRMTPQRKLILDVFLRTDRHVASEELYDMVKRKESSTGQATVYRTLKLLSGAGLAKEVDFGDGLLRYEHDYAHEHHDHIICKRCNRQIEVMDERIERLQETLAKKHGFSLTGHKMYLYGICQKCSVPSR